ncbi:anhydro-N-acetylmuramic acid kinase [Dolichospermum circinale CS-1225]|uniref:Anhydro-N-acetylmuramic acid kinase n=1 Tax=Dolichospermum circinale CS-537/01 TaxID=3021739 RepID=A0ABT5A2U3_9CYAN|nr:anhydro-N-acetylmuramic acid kinase [Dolichospermum circinale]MDB9457553.1 anhydro-N-acetylmuramic acid kinase [Dolichospermum circinale CS-545/17]MDB9466323.1 anhydro-N-acetylmuramic acid kinase [Dolichospermum circinale CS-539/09]MDB9470466.1 anhydro-N-acetylmuramic acid kinase [Dolichospermum circinale CS-539]MDB9485441.1 anhydro-N-acetylmuramic acid kinase [Dolichospermum circinale CS-537/01]MDB9520357.1 anhydro-N-acetylmuramic acid kinase [Dolichospermum circinale CS-1225]
MHPTRVIGLMSGTSVDGIDTALVEISGRDLDLKVELIAGETYPYPPQLREQILELGAGAAVSMAELATIDDAISRTFAEAAQFIQVGHQAATLIGSHGQTVYHRPRQEAGELGYSLQLGRGSLIAHLTGITTVSNFRTADIAVSGHGAPLVPRVDAYLLGDSRKERCIQNIGGISNVTYLPAVSDNWLCQIRGWDTGPGNSLLDLAVQHFTNGAKTYDENGDWAASGTPCYPLLEKWLSHEYFHLPPPKSTGRELFGVAYLHQCLEDAQGYQFSTWPADFLATITELTAVSIVHNYDTFLPRRPHQVLLCGGGSRNIYLKRRLELLLGKVPVSTTDQLGISACFKEAIAFAVLAYWRSVGIPGNLPSVTGASQEVLLGEIHGHYR